MVPFINSITTQNAADREKCKGGDIIAKRKRRMSKKAAAFIAREARKQYRHGKAAKQAVAIAYAKARKKGYRIAARKKR